MESTRTPAPAAKVPSTSYIQRLPNELLIHLLTFLDSSGKTQESLRQDPEKLTRPVHSADNLHLKSASLVCRLWRQSVLPLLFRNVVWSLQRFHKPKGFDIASQIPVLEFLHRNDLSKHVESFTLFIDPPKETGGSRHSDGQFWGILPPEDDPPEAPKSWNILWSAFSAESPQFSSNQRPASADGLTAGEVNSTTPRVWDNNWLWHALFGQIDPLQFNLISSPDILSSLLSRTVDLSSEWAFNSHYHILSLSQASRLGAKSRNVIPGIVARLPSQSPSTAGNSVPSDLFSVRDWAALVVNEGSFVPVYSAYEFFHYSPPSLLPVILSTTDSSFKRIRETLRSLSYIATFPLSRHIRDVVIPCCPPVEHLYMQLMPRAVDFWQDAKLSHIDITDLWLECDMAYSLIMRDVFDRDADQGLKSLRVFESGDTATQEAWSMAMQYAQIHGLQGWKMKREGFFVRKDVDNAC
ncbi:hypothetical protein BGZ63DRAFT_19753 [Mariannaea sp. PMI_226]|nr:hypothetical protein BGZ63DRAFT_19753 [Mariannaea sp. PMI_226]